MPGQCCICSRKLIFLRMLQALPFLLKYGFMVMECDGKVNTSQAGAMLKPLLHNCGRQDGLQVEAKERRAHAVYCWVGCGVLKDKKR